MRLDVYLIEQQLFPSREKAKLAIESGHVLVNGKAASKPGLNLKPDDVVEVAEHKLLQYVSLGGFKLEKIIQTFQLDFQGKTVLDVGSSTGGFTDCALQHGAKHVTAVDVGSEQLHSSLRSRADISLHEQTNIKDFQLPNPVDYIVMDVSFTSQTLIIPELKRFLKPGGAFLSLIKPQFELDQRTRLSNGIITDPALRQKGLDKVLDSAAYHGFKLQGIVEAPIQPKKNIEYMAWFTV